MHNETHRPLCDVEAAEIAGLSRRAIRNALETGALPAVRIGRARLIDRDALERWRAAMDDDVVEIPPEPRSWLDYARRAASGAQT